MEIAISHEIQRIHTHMERYGPCVVSFLFLSVLLSLTHTSLPSFGIIEHLCSLSLSPSEKKCWKEFRDMASSLSSTSPPTNLRLSLSSNSFRLCPKPNNLRFFSNTKGCPPGHMVLCSRVKAQLNEVALDGSSNATLSIKAKSNEEAPTKPSDEPSSSVLATQESVSQFITQVASLVKLVDSRDIVELKMKQHDCEVTIRKKEAMPQLQPAPQPVPAYSPPSLGMPPIAPASPPTPTPTRPTPTPSPPAAKSAKSSHPPLKCPMAGTFYRSPGPGEPPFVKVGDKVKKGQVVCIVEAMKLMNEIEADQSGTIVEILAEDGKPVSVDTPLFVIEP